MEIFENFGIRLKGTRKKRGISRKDLAAKLGLSNPTQISRYESGKAFPPLPTLQKLATILQIDLHWLLMGEISLAVKRLKPFAQSHLAQMAKQSQDLLTERSELNIKGTIGEIHTVRYEEINGELENIRLYCQTVRQVLNEVLEPMGESI
jgi:transcriptional regulator with XRE-family HTH domain